MTIGTKLFWIFFIVIFLAVNIPHQVLSVKHLMKIKTAKKAYKNINKIVLKNNNKMWLLSYLRQIDPFVFEELILYALKKKGYKIYRNKRYTGDGGIDGKVKIQGEKFLIQAKRYKNNINLQHVNNFIDVCHKNKKRGFFIHTGKTGAETKELLLKNPQIILLSGEKLYELFIETNQLAI